MEKIHLHKVTTRLISTLQTAGILGDRYKSAQVAHVGFGDSLSQWESPAGGSLTTSETLGWLGGLRESSGKANASIWWSSCETGLWLVQRVHMCVHVCVSMCMQACVCDYSCVHVCAYVCVCFMIPRRIYHSVPSDLNYSYFFKLFKKNC